MQLIGRLDSPRVRRVAISLLATCGAPEADSAQRPHDATSETIDPAGLVTAVVRHLAAPALSEPSRPAF